MFIIKHKPSWLTSELILLVLIFLLGSFSRLYRLDLNPPALNWDEVSQGWNAYSILKTGKDEWGVALPSTFRAFGEYKLPLYIYATILPVAILGLNPVAVRLVSAIAGSLAILGIYMLANNLVKRRLKLGRQSLSFGLVAALTLALTPWHYFISRPAVEANLSLTLVIFGFAFLSTRSPKPISWFTGLSLLALSLHTYNSARVFVPMMLIAWLVFKRRELKLKPVLVAGLVVFAASLGLVLAQFLAGTGLARYQKLAILSQNTVYQIGQNRLNSTLPQPLPRLIYNRPVYFSLTLVKNYLNYFSPEFLYQTRGQSQFALLGVNILGIPILVLLLIGLLKLLTDIRRENYLFLLSWLLLAPLPAALTAEPPQALRPLFLIPVIVILAAIGFTTYLNVFRAKRNLKIVGAILMVGVLVLAFGKYTRLYWLQYRPLYASAWQDGYKELFAYLRANETNYERVIVTKRLGEPHIYLAFFGQLPPEDLQPGENNIRFAQSDWWWTDRVDKYYFVNDWVLISTAKDFVRLESGEYVPLRGSLIAASAGNLPTGSRKLTEIRDLNGELVFEIGEFK